MCPKYLLRFYRCKRGLNLHSRYAKAVVLSFLQHHLEQRYTLANDMPKHFSCHSRHAKTLVLPFPLCKNILHFSCDSGYTITLFLPFPLCLNTFHAIPPTPIHYTWSHLAMPGHHLATPGIDLAALGIHLATYGYTWSPVTVKFHFPTILQKGASNKSFSYLNIAC